MALKPIEIVINAKDEASKVFDGLNTKLKAVAAAVATYFGINAFANVITGAANFEEAMSRVQAATNSSGEELKALQAAAENAGATTKYTAVEAANALENLAKAGLTGKEAIAALPPVMAMAQAGGVSLADASERLTGVVMGMGLSFSESARVADVLAMGANASRTSITGLAEALSYAAPIAKSLNLPLESTVAIMAQFANAGIDASRAGTALNSILAQFSDPASKFREELSKLGINTRDFDQALKQLAATGPAGADAVRAVGLEAGPALQAALNLGIPALEELRAKLLGAEGSAAATAKIMGENLNGALKGLGSAWDSLKNTLGTPVLPVLKAGVEELTTALRTAVDNGTVAKFGTALATAFQSAIEWVRQFAASFDFKQTAADMQAFAMRAGEVFTQIGQYATNAGNIVKTAYGAMSAGVNAVLMPIYGIGAAFAKTAQEVMEGVAVIRDGLAKITFGQLSKDFALAAEDARSAAQGFGDAAEAMRLKAVESFNGAADGAQLATDGFEGLAGAAQETKVATDAGAQSLEDMSEAMRKEAEAAYAAMEAADKKAGAEAAAAAASDKHKQAVEANTAAIAALKKEYQQAIKTGDWEEVNRLHQQINAQVKQGEFLSKQAAAATKGNAAANKELAAAAAQSSSALELKNKVQQADLTLVQSGLELKKASIDAALAVAQANGREAEAARLKIEQKKIEIEIIKATVNVQKAEAEGAIAVAKAKIEELKASGDLTEQKKTELEIAIKVAQAKLNAANATGMSTKAIQAEIDALRGVSQARGSDAGSIANHTAATNANTAATNGRSDAWEKIMMQYTMSADYTKRQIELLKEEAAAIEEAAEARRKYWNIDKDGFTMGSNGQRMTQFMPYQNYITEGAKGQGLTDQQILKLQEQFWQNGQATGYGQDGKDWFSAVNEAISKASADSFKQRADAERAIKDYVAYGRTLLANDVRAFEDMGLTVPDAIKPKTQAPSAPTPAPPPRHAPAPAPTLAPRPAPTPPTGWDGNGGRMSITPAPTYVSNINLPGVGSARAMFDNPGDQASMESMLRALTSAAGVAQ